jgi:hypothetical protein
MPVLTVALDRGLLFESTLSQYQVCCTAGEIEYMFRYLMHMQQGMEGTDRAISQIMFARRIELAAKMIAHWVFVVPCGRKFARGGTRPTCLLRPFSKLPRTWSSRQYPVP